MRRNIERVREKMEKKELPKEQRSGWSGEKCENSRIELKKSIKMWRKGLSRRKSTTEDIRSTKGDKEKKRRRKKEIYGGDRKGDERRKRVECHQ